MLESSRVRLAVPCQYHACRHAAAMVELLPGPGSARTLMVTGFADGSEVAEPVPDGPLTAAIVSGATDLPILLYDRDPAWAPFLCPVCERCYCADHWHGSRCPYGH